MAALTALAIGSLAVGAAGLVTQQVGASQARSAAAGQAAVSRQAAQSSAQYTGLEEGINQQAAALSSYGATESNIINKDIFAKQQGVEEQRFGAMELDARRRQLEVIRNQQRARSIGLTTATAQGARQGSGLQGGYAQASGQAGVNLSGIQQNLEIGRNIFGLNSDISKRRMDASDLQTTLAQQQADLTTQKSKLIAQYAQVQAGYATQSSQFGTQLSTAQGLSGLGTSLLQGAGTLFSAGNTLSSALQTGPGTSPMDISYQGPQMGNAYLPTPTGPRGFY